MCWSQFIIYIFGPSPFPLQMAKWIWFLKIAVDYLEWFTFCVALFSSYIYICNCMCKNICEWRYTRLMLTLSCWCYFYQLRTQALASLHSGLQLNQGIPVAHVAMWLGMEVLFLAWCGLNSIEFASFLFLLLLDYCFMEGFCSFKLVLNLCFGDEIRKRT